MAAKDNLTKTADIQSTARVIDFVTRFARNWEHLREILGIMQPYPQRAGRDPEEQDCLCYPSERERWRGRGDPILQGYGH